MQRIDQGKPVFGTFKGERADAKVMGNPSKNPYSNSDSISYGLRPPTRR
jgi:hypothetical protein